MDIPGVGISGVAIPAESWWSELQTLVKEARGSEGDLVVQLKPFLRLVFPPVPPQEAEQLSV